MATAATGVPGPHAWTATPPPQNREDTACEGALNSNTPSANQWLKLSEIWQLLPKHLDQGFVWSTLKEMDFSLGNSVWVIPIGTPAKDIQALSVVENAKGRLLPLYRALIVDARRALESGEIEAEGCKSALDAPRIKIDPEFWAHADFYTAPLHKCTVDFAGVRWYRIRVRRCVATKEMGSDKTKPPVGRRKGVSTPAVQKAKDVLFIWLRNDGRYPVKLDKRNGYTVAFLYGKIANLLQDGGMAAKEEPARSTLYALIPDWIKEYNESNSGSARLR